MTDWRPATLKDVERLLPDIEDIVAHLSDYGREPVDYDKLIHELESRESGEWTGTPSLDFGNDMESPVIKAILKHARRINRELKES